VFGASPRRFGLEQRADFVDLLDLLRVEPRDDRPGMRHGLDQALGLEVTQHFPHDGPADTELIAQGALDQAVAGTIEALRDCVAQFLQRQFAQRKGERRLRGVAEVAAGAAVADLTASISLSGVLRGIATGFKCRCWAKGAAVC